MPAWSLRITEPARVEAKAVLLLIAHAASDWLGKAIPCNPDAWSGTKLPENPMSTAALSDMDLFCGLMFSSALGFLVGEINGGLVKTPSWWLKKVQVKIMFDYVGGTWLQTVMEAVANVRVFGNQTLTSETVEFRNTGVGAGTHIALLVHAQ
jgi:hypothetical protein